MDCLSCWLSCCSPSAPFGPYQYVQKSKKACIFYIYIGHSSRRWSRFKISGKKNRKKVYKSLVLAPRTPLAPIQMCKNRKKACIFYIYIGHSWRRWSRFKISGKKSVQIVGFREVFTKLSRNQLKGNFEIWFNI